MIEQQGNNRKSLRLIHRELNEQLRLEEEQREAKKREEYLELKRQEDDRKEIETIRNFFIEFTESSISSTINDFSIIPNILFAIPPREYTNFDIPQIWKDKTVLFKYKSISSNYYRAPLQRVTCNHEDVPICNCTIGNTF